MTRTSRAAFALLLVAIAAICLSCIGTRGDPAAVVRADLEREAIVVAQRDAFLALADRVEGWTAEQRADLRRAADEQVQRYRQLAEAERVYLEATGAPDWRDVAREAAAIGGDLAGVPPGGARE